ncbi:MAG: leucyl aminopeptidase [Nitrosomonadales bacterium]|nr:leucyl aminopeptidase [Nitrosomonadales bacterium]
MEFSIKTGSPEKQRSDCIVVGVFEGGKLSGSALALDKAAKHYLSDIIARGDMNGKTTTTLLLHHVPNTLGERVLLVGLGKSTEFHAKQFLDAACTAMRAVQKTGAKDATLYLAELPVLSAVQWSGQAASTGSGQAWCLTQAVLAAYETSYRFDRLKSKPEKDNKSLHKIHFGLLDGKQAAALKTVLAQAVATAQGMKLAKDLGNLPGNICTPTYLAAQALALAKSHKSIKTTVLEEKDMRKLGMGSLLSVTRGSEQPAKLITLEYHGADKKQKPIVLVGKGITFDSGGISLKPGAEMDEMKYDMCGAASVLGTLQAIAEMGLKLNVVGVIPACENLPSGRATKPGDIVTSMSGQTIEILNTDAEGRLILCDALTYAGKFKPDTVVDIATLTGACVIALGHVASGLFSNRDDLAKELLAAGEQIYDRAWQLPLWEDYQQLLDSNFADMQNIGGRAGGTITAACFLSRFTKDYRWAHLDIAGTAHKSGKDKGATGRPVPLLTQYLINRANSK